MFRRWRDRNGPIGCALFEREVRLAQLALDRRGGRSMRAVREPIATDAEPTPDVPEWREAAVAAVQRALAGGGFEGRRGVSCLPVESIDYRHLRMAPMPESELATAVRWRAANELEQDPEQICADYLDVGETLDGGRPRREVVAVAAAQADVESHMAMIREAGLQLMALDAGAAAIASCLTGASAADGAGDAAGGGAQLVVDLGLDRSVLMVVHEGSLRLIRSIETSRRLIIKRAAARTGLGVAGHDLLWRLLCGDEPSEGGRDATVEQARQALEKTVTESATDLAHEVAMCVHYLTEGRLLDAAPAVACVVGAGSEQARMTAALDAASRVAFKPLHQLLPPSVLALADSLPPGDAIEPWLLPIGLASYGLETVVQGAAA